MSYKILLVTCLSCIVIGSIYDIVVGKLKCSCVRETGLDVSKVEVYFTNYATDGIEYFSYIDDAANSILQSDILKDQCVDIFIHGFNNPITHESYNIVKSFFAEAECNRKKPFFIMICSYEYTKGGKSALKHLTAYKDAVRFSKSIGQAVGKMVMELFSCGAVDPANLSILGFSLGGHMAGYAGAYVKQESSFSVARIEGADAAGPCFDDCPDEHLQSGQADLVIAYHCSTPLGSVLDMCDYDIYSNDGKGQAGCPKNTCYGRKGAACSHYSCIPISLLPSITDGIWDATKCSCYEDYKSGRCDGNEHMLAGYRVSPTGSQGKYYFDPSGYACGNVITP